MEETVTEGVVYYICQEIGDQNIEEREIKIAMNDKVNKKGFRYAKILLQIGAENSSSIKRS